MQFGGKKFAEAFPPADFIKEELEARGWSQADLAAIMGRAPNVISELLTGKRSITNKTAEELGEAFGTGAQYWLNLQAAYEAYKLRGGGEQGSVVARKARLYKKAPIREMIRRGWIKPSDDVSNLEEQLKRFFETESLDEELPFRAQAYRKSSSYSDVTPAQLAWFYGARHLSKTGTARDFSNESLDLARRQIRSLLSRTEGVREVPAILSEGGIRFVVVEALSGTRIDGACFWLNRNSPVIAITLRYDRIDGFWHTVAHELEHIEKREGLEQAVIDPQLVGQRAEDKPEEERLADKLAAELLIPGTELERFIGQVGPYYSKDKIRRFAEQIGVHPAIVVGQLQFRGEISYAHNREMLEKVRAILAESESLLMDGWGRTTLAALAA